jgi:hypothetical protein
LQSACAIGDRLVLPEQTKRTRRWANPRMAGRESLSVETTRKAKAARMTTAAAT